MEMAREDMLEVRNILATDGVELTPDDLIEILVDAEPDLRIVDEPGLVTEIKKIRKERKEREDDAIE